MRYTWIFVFLLSLLASPAMARLTIEITSGMDNPTPIAVVPFAGTAGLPEDIQEMAQPL